MQTILNPDAPIFKPPSKMKIYSKSMLLSLSPTSVSSASASSNSSTESFQLSSKSSSFLSSTWSSSPVVSSAIVLPPKTAPAGTNSTSVSAKLIQSAIWPKGTKSFSSSLSSPSVLSTKLSSRSSLLTSTPKEPQCSRFSRRPARDVLPADLPKPILSTKSTLPRAILGRGEYLGKSVVMNDDEVHYGGREFRNMNRNISRFRIKEETDNKLNNTKSEAVIWAE